MPAVTASRSPRCWFTGSYKWATLERAVLTASRKTTHTLAEGAASEAACHISPTPQTSTIVRCVSVIGRALQQLWHQRFNQFIYCSPQHFALSADAGIEVQWFPRIRRFYHPPSIWCDRTKNHFANDIKKDFPGQQLIGWRENDKKRRIFERVVYWHS